MSAQKQPGRCSDGGLTDFHARADWNGLLLRWLSLAGLVPPEPLSPASRYIWRYGDTRPYLFQGSKPIDADVAERRILRLQNEGMPREAKIVRNLYAASQIIQPGEIAHHHHYTLTALRLIIEGHGGSTSVDRAPTNMEQDNFDPHFKYRFRFAGLLNGDWAIATIANWIPMFFQRTTRSGLSTHRQYRLCRRRGIRTFEGQRSRLAGPRAMASSCRARRRVGTKDASIPCFSELPTGPCRKSWGIGGNVPALHEFRQHAFHPATRAISSGVD